MCCAWLCAQICAFLSSLFLLVFDFADFAIGAALVLESGLVPPGSAYVHRFPAKVAVATYGGFLVLLAGVSCLGVGLKSVKCLIAASAMAALGLVVELAAAFLLLSDVDVAEKYGVDVPRAWALILAAAAARHALRLGFSRSLRSSRAVFAATRAYRRAEDTDRAAQLSERLLARRGEREEQRRHFNDKYFGGKTPEGDPTPPPSNPPSTEMPSFLLSKESHYASFEV
jgi:hypothetical protein